jgi:hypothetical protein
MREAIRGETRETQPVAPLHVARLGPFAGLELAHLEAAEALAGIAGEAADLAKLAIVDYVDADFDLLLDDLFDRARKPLLELCQSVRLRRYLDNAIGARERAGVGNNDPFAASFHLVVSFVCPYEPVILSLASRQLRVTRSGNKQQGDSDLVACRVLPVPYISFATFCV